MTILCAVQEAPLLLDCSPLPADTLPLYVSAAVCLPQPRTSAYEAALTQNPSLLKGATVLDVGCGTSILSLFAAKGGAAAVVGLDGSERIAGFARQVRQGHGDEGSSKQDLHIHPPPTCNHESVECTWRCCSVSPWAFLVRGSQTCTCQAARLHWELVTLPGCTGSLSGC